MVFHYKFFVLILALSKKGGVYSLKVFISSKKMGYISSLSYEKRENKLKE